MPESEKVAENIEKIKWRLESIDSSQTLMIKANRDKYLSVVKKVFESSRQRVNVYHDVDARRSQKQLVEDLEIDKGNLSRHLKALREGGLIEVKQEARDGSVIYKKTKWDKILSISKWLKEEFGES